MKWPAMGMVLALCLGVFVFLALHARGPKLPAGEAFDWTSLEDKQKVAAALNDSVNLKDFRAEVHIVSLRENFWGIARRFKINIDTVYGLNPDLEDLVVNTNRPLLLANQRGTLHQVKAGDDLASVAKLYSADPAELKSANRIGFFGLHKGQLLFIPGGKPKQFNEKLASLYQRRSLLRSPLAGRTTSTMGTRSDPFTGMTKHHNGIDLKAKLNEL
ncbi:MAG: LysM peptidoglycan-binding domain-containing protein, partial [candidate division FCPU426 bacterium]